MDAQPCVAGDHIIDLIITPDNEILKNVFIIKNLIKAWLLGNLAMEAPLINLNLLIG